jgi:hypothetical protein
MFQLIGQDPDFDAEMMQAYNDLFKSKMGPKVLTHMLMELGFFDQTIPGISNLTDEDRARQDYAKRLLMWTGTWNFTNAREIVEKMLKLKPIINKSEKEDKDALQEGR